MISWQRFVYILCLAIVEGTPVALPLVLVGIPSAWGLLVLIVLAGTLADWLVAGWLPVEWQRAALLGAGFVLAAWAISVVISGPGQQAGWGAAFGALFSLTNPRAGLAYLTLLMTLYAFRRGTRLLDHDSISLRNLFARASLGLILILGFAALLTAPSRDVHITLTTVMLLSFFAVGLLAIALASATEEHDIQLNRLGWRGLITMIGVIGLVLVLGLLLASLFGQEIVQSVRTIIQTLFLLAVLITLPFLLILQGILEQLVRLVNLRDFLRILEQRQLELQQQQTQATDVLNIFPPWLQALLRALLALLPVLVLIALYLLMRRRTRRISSRDEERESLWSWTGLKADLRDLLSSLRRSRRDEGLGAALLRLRGADPVSRIRRSYIRLLLIGEAHARPRAAPQTPHEYVANASGILPAAVHPITVLTDTYERARYHPSSVSSADADLAERAWTEIDTTIRET